MVDLIKPGELDPAASVDTDAALMIDNAGSVLKATPEQVVDAGAPVPTEAEAITGTDNVMRMTPLTTRQVLDNEVAPAVLRAQAWAESPAPPDPLVPDSKSSKTWAGIAQAAGEIVSITSGAGFPTRADFAVAISTGALDGLEDGQVVSAAGLQYVKKVGSTAIPDLDDWEPSGDVVYTGHFGVQETGDQTSKIRAMHSFSNASNRMASYADISKVSISAFLAAETANQIPVNTSVDFAGCKLNVLNAYFPTPGGMPRRVFLISDPETLLETISGDVTSPATNLLPGSFRPTAGLYDGSGYVRMTTTKQVPNRNEDGTVNYQHTFWMLNGWAKQPLTANFTAHGTGVSLQVRKSSRQRIRISNVALLEDGWNNLTLFRVERNQVDIDGFSLIVTGERVSSDSISHLIMCGDCGDVSIKNVKASGRPGNGTYNLSITGGAEYSLENFQLEPFQGESTWSGLGTNFINGLYVKNSTLDRLDAHEFGWNFYCEDVVFTKIGMIVGRGGGTFSLDRCKGFQTPLFSSRVDYGGYYENALIRLADCEWHPAAVTGFGNVMVDFFSVTYGVGSVVASEVPDIIIDGLKVKPPSGSNMGCVLVGIKTRASASSSVPVYAPNFINIRGVDLDPNIRWSVDVEWKAFSSRGRSAERSYLKVTDVNGFYGGLTHGILDLEPKITQTASYNLLVHLDNVNQPNIKFDWMNTAAFRVRDSVIWNLNVPSGGAEVLIYNCQGAAGSVANKLGGSNNNATVSTKIFGFYVPSGTSAYDLSTARVIQGVHPIGTMVLPAGVTADTALSGWKSA